MHVKITGIIFCLAFRVAQTEVIRYYPRFEIADLSQTNNKMMMIGTTKL